MTKKFKISPTTVSFEVLSTVQPQYVRGSFFTMIKQGIKFSVVTILIVYAIVIIIEVINNQNKY